MENKYEKESILSMIDKALYEKMHLEFDSDSVTEQIIKIKHHFDALEYSKKQLDNLREDVLELFLSDGKHEALEENMLHLMNHLLRK